MRKRIGLGMLAGLALALMAPRFATAQAMAVGADGTMAQEQPFQAIPPEHQASAEQLNKLFELLRIRMQVAQVRHMIPNAIEGQLRQQVDTLNGQARGGAKLTDPQRRQVEALISKYVDKSVDLYPVDEMISDMTSIYQKYVTREDVDAMIAFYSSPAGQHFLDVQPRIAQEFMPIVMRRVEERSRPLVAEMAKEMASLERSWHPAAAPATKK